MHKLIAKIARLAASKAAAFGYAVAVGVAGNLAFNFVQQHHQAALVVAAPERAESAGTAAVPPLRAPEQLRAPARLAPVATAPILPNPQPVTLPGPDALPTPALKPATLPVPAMKPLPPPREEAALPAPEDPAKPHFLVVPPLHEETAKPSAPVGADSAAPATTAAASALPPPASLPPLGPAVDVSTPPEPPSRPAKVITGSSSESEVASLHKANPSAAPTKDRSWELSDVWHPGRVMKKGLHWAGDQLPVIGGAEAEPQFPRAGPPPAAPIPLLPPATRPSLSENASAPGVPSKPASPGPGSGGLY